MRALNKQNIYTKKEFVKKIEVSIWTFRSDCSEKAGIYRSSHRPYEFSTRPFFRWVVAQGHCPDTPSASNNASAFVGILLKKSTSGAGW